MKNLKAKIQARYAMAMLALASSPVYAQTNPFIQGMQDGSTLTIAKAVIVVCALIILGGTTIPKLMEGNGGEVVKSALGVAVLLALAVKLKEVMGLFAQFA